MIWRPLWSRGLQNQQGWSMKETTSLLYFICFTTITNTPVFCNLRSKILLRQRTWKIYLGWQHEANGIHQDMVFELSVVNCFKQSSHMSKLQYLSSWSILYTPYHLSFLAPSRKKLKKGVYKSKEKVKMRLLKLG